jgi:hypothetical protein
MLEPEVIAEIQKEISRIYADIETDLVAGIAKELAKGTKGASISAASWRIQKLQQMGRLSSKLADVLAKGSSKNLLRIEAVITEGMKQAANADDLVIKEAAKVQKAVAAIDWVPAIKTDAFAERTKAAILNARSALNLTNTTALEAANASWVQSVNSAYIKTVSGAKTIQQSIMETCKELGGTGIRINYISDAGRATTYSLDAAVRRDVVTSINQASSQLTVDRCQQYDCDLVEVTAHAGSRPEHADWQGKIYSLTGKTKGYRMLEDATGYGTVSGLCGANCQHSFYPYFPGMSKQQDHSELKGIDQEQAYKDSQKQRYYERIIRSDKRSEAALRSAGFESEAQKVSQHRASVSSNFSSFLDESGRTRRRDRERV